VSGVTGLGGALLLIPVLLGVPPLLGGVALSAKEGAGLSAVHVSAAAVIGAALNGRRSYVNLGLVARIGAPMAPAGLVGAIASAALPNGAILAVYATMATAALALLLLPLDAAVEDVVPVPWRTGAGVGAVVGLLAGVVGAGGAFLLIPLMVRRLHVPLRVAVGSSLAITLASAAAALVGKLGAGQVPLHLAPWIVGGAVPGALLGAQLGHRLPANGLRLVLLALIAVAVIRSWLDVAALL
jgi:uncharacterized membrane protein YfcA